MEVAILVRISLIITRYGRPYLYELLVDPRPPIHEISELISSFDGKDRHDTGDIAFMKEHIRAFETQEKAPQKCFHLQTGAGAVPPTAQRHHRKFIHGMRQRKGSLL